MTTASAFSWALHLWASQLNPLPQPLVLTLLLLWPVLVLPTSWGQKLFCCSHFSIQELYLWLIFLSTLPAHYLHIKYWLWWSPWQPRLSSAFAKPLIMRWFSPPPTFLFLFFIKAKIKFVERAHHFFFTSNKTYTLDAHFWPEMFTHKRLSLGDIYFKKISRRIRIKRMMLEGREDLVKWEHREGFQRRKEKANREWISVCFVANPWLCITFSPQMFLCIHFLSFWKFRFLAYKMGKYNTFPTLLIR